MNALITPTEAERLIAESLGSLDAETIPFQDALGRVLRETLIADRDFPPFDRVMMDGIACRAADLPQPLAIQGLHAAGSPNPEPLQAEHCWQIMTGSVLPPDCDTIIPVEELALTETTATLTTDFKPTPGQFIHRKGSDCLCDTPLLEQGCHLTPAHIALAATVGATELSVTKQPKVSILTTGDELVPVTQSPLPHQIRQSNGYFLSSALKSDTNQVTLTHLPDDPSAIQQELQSALQASDLILFTGGISKGKKDFIRPILEHLVGEPTFHGIAQKPGKPLAYWKPSKTSPAVFALPGNPNSTLTTYYRYVRPALKQLLGAPSSKPTTLPLTEPIQQHPKLTLFFPATLQHHGTLHVAPPQNSGDIPAFLSATGIIEVPPGHDFVNQGSYRAI